MSFREKTRQGLVLGLALVVIAAAWSIAGHGELARGKKVLVVTSYHEGYEWSEDIIATLREELPGAQFTVFHLDTKRNPGNGKEKGAQAWALYKSLQPDAVIAVADNAQTFFVVPYLRGKSSTPVIFCGVNDDASRYGYPAANVTGVLEKKQYRESFSFAQLVDPKIRAVGVLYRPSPSNSVNLAQIEKEKAGYTVDVITTIPVESMAEVRKALSDYGAAIDALLILNLTGITDDSGAKLEGREAIARITGETDLVTIGVSDWEVEAGALCGVVKTGEEQGVLAARQLLVFWEGVPISEIPIARNTGGRRVINMKTLRKLNIPLQPEIITGTTLISGK
ncbi:MAG: ABC transporter substrate binding protein [Desulfobulbaceae bacterium]